MLRFASLAGLIVCAGAETLKVGDFAQGAEFSKCIKVTDFNTKALGDEVEVTDKVDGCCAEGYIPGIKHYNNYWGSMIICGFKDDGSIAMSSKTSNSVKTCTYNKCYVVKMDITCKDSSKMTLDGCCPKDQYTDNCKSYVKSQSFFKEKVGYCLSYQKKYKLEGTSEKTDDQVTADGVTSLSLTNLKAYTVCPGGWGSGSAGYELVGDAACKNDAGSPGKGDLKFSKTTDKSDPHTNCQAACSADATCTGYDDRASGCLYYKIKITGSNKASTAYQCYRKVVAAAAPAAAAPAPAEAAPAPAAPADAPAETAPAPAPAAEGGSGTGPVVGGKELTCDDETYIKPTLEGFASTFENYKSCDEKTQKYKLEVSGYETELQAGKNGNSNKYGLGMMCADGNMYYIYTKDTEVATWDALKASPPDESGVVLKCLLKEGSSAPPATASSAVGAAAGMVGILSAFMMA